MELAERLELSRMQADTAERIAGIRARLGNASEGPWRAVLDRRDGPEIVIGDGAKWVADDLPSPVWNCDDPEDGCMDEAAKWSRDATFLAHARADIPFLLAEVERLEALVAQGENPR